MPHVACKPILRDGVWRCLGCGHTEPTRFVRYCGEVERRMVPTETAGRVLTQVQSAALERDLIVKFLKRSGDKPERTVARMLELLSVCESCPEFRLAYCARDKGCDARTVFRLRLQLRRCPEWPE